jgi:hypothetical protein
MCIASMISDDYSKSLPWRQPSPILPPYPGINPDPNPFDKLLTPPASPISREEWEALRKEVEELRELLSKAKQYDAAHDEPDCESEEKVAFAKKLGEAFEVDIEQVLAEPASETRLYNPNEIFRVISNSRGELARFETKALADKFATYVTNYSGDKSVYVLEATPTDISSLLWAVFVDDKLVAAFASLEDANTHGLIVKDAAKIFSSTAPEPEVRILLI